MSDRKTPIKFGPEWLRDLSRAHNTESTSPSMSSAATTVSTTGAVTGSVAGTGEMKPSPATPVTTSPSVTPAPKVLLAKLRYGREEMLALYDRNTLDTPPELKFNEVLYKSREKLPLALNNTFEPEMRDNGPPTGTISAVDRVSAGRGRGININDGRGRSRMPFARPSSTGRNVSWYAGNTKMPGLASGSEEESPGPRSWNASSSNNLNRNSSEPMDWTNTKLFRSKRQNNTNNNWRQQQREELLRSSEQNHEWRTDSNRAKTNQPDKSERDWGERQTQDKPSWNSGRRTWVAGDTQNIEENLPEWAVSNTTEVCAGSFDSSGAFLGYSNDDSNLPKKEESPYSLTRSHTQGSFSRSKGTDEDSGEWWSSEKGHKLSMKKFDSRNVKTKKVTFQLDKPEDNFPSDTDFKDVPEKMDTMSSVPDPPEEMDDDYVDKNYTPKNSYNSQFVESKTFNSLANINLDETTDEISNFQSVMIAPNNSLRQKHQNIVSATTTHSTSDKEIDKHKTLLRMLKDSAAPKGSDNINRQNTTENDLAEELFDLNLHEKNEISKLPSVNDNLLPNISSSNISTGTNNSHVPRQSLQMGMVSTDSHAAMLNMTSNQALGTSRAVQGAGVQNITDLPLNATLGMSVLPGNNTLNMGMPLQGVPSPVVPISGITNTGICLPRMQSGAAGITGFPSNVAMQAVDVSNKSLFLGQNTSNTPQLPSPHDIPLPNSGQTNIFQVPNLPQGSNQSSSINPTFGSNLYGNLMPQPSPQPNTSNQNYADQWYYEDPMKNIQGPFSSKEMYYWYKAGFFGPSLMVRRAIETQMRPLASYGPVVPFTLNMRNMTENPTIDPLQYGSVGLMRTPNFGQQQMVDSLWSQPSSADLLWMQEAMNAVSNPCVNSSQMFSWDQERNSIVLPEEVAKGITTEDEILAQLRGSQNPISLPPTSSFINEQLPPRIVNNRTEEIDNYGKVTPNLEELQKLMSNETIVAVAPVSVPQTKIDLQKTVENNAQPLQTQYKVVPEVKQTKSETEKTAKLKENIAVKAKSKTKSEKEKKDDLPEIKFKESNVIKLEKKRPEESVPFKSKKEEKANKKELEKEKKEWLKEGFTIVKGSERNVNKENKKKTEEIKAAEDAEKKRKEDEKLAGEEEKRKKQAETTRKQLEQQQQRQISESMNKKAPWSAVACQTQLTVDKDGLTLAEIQRLEREKKLEQMKEQQQMMQIIAQQQAAALAREQEMQAGLAWSKKKGANANLPNQSLSEIQAETRKSVTATVAKQPVPEEVAPVTTSLANHVPWSNAQNGAAGFWDTQPNRPNSPEKAQVAKSVEQGKSKKKANAKKFTSPADEFTSWCSGALTSWSSKIDVPTFVGFLKDIESPYEVKDYVKCYLGDTKESNDFARQFLERRSKLLRVGMVTPSDDLCSPAVAINPRNPSSSEFQEVKGKGKKTKKNKMLKVDARILGFSVTAAEDRINVGDIDTA